MEYSLRKFKQSMKAFLQNNYFLLQTTSNALLFVKIKKVLKLTLLHLIKKLYCLLLIWGGVNRPLK